MRNHDEKARDMARSVLPSTRRRGARQGRAHARSRERSHLRAALRDLASCDDPDDYEGDLTWEARREIGWMVEDRRTGDKVAPLMRWAERKLVTDPELAAASFDERTTHFRGLLPDGLIGRHALFHLRWVLDDEVPWWRRQRATRPGPRPTLREKVEAIVLAGRHGELNRRIRHASARYYVKRVWVPPRRLVDDDHPAPGLLLAGHWTTVHEPVQARFLRGAHDIDAFVKEGDPSHVHNLYDDLVRDGLI